MNHEICRERLLDLAYGELSRREASELEHHLAECEPCRLERDRLTSTLTAMRRLEAPPPPDRSEAVVLAAARRAAEERRRDSFGLALRGFGIRIAAGTAFAVLAVLLLVNVRGLRSPTDEVARERAAARGQGVPSAGPAPAAQPPSVAPVAGPSTASARSAAPRPERDPAAPTEDRPGARREPGGPAKAEEKSVPPPRERGSGDVPPAGDEAPAARQGGEAAPAKKSAPRDEPSVARGRAFAQRPPEAPAAPTPSAGADRGANAKAAAPRSGDTPESSAAAGVREAWSARADEAERLASAARRAAPGASDERHPQPAAAPAPRASQAPPGPAARQDRPAQRAGPVGAWARDVERRRATGELSEAQKRFEPCPGGDVRRTAWIDGEQHILKLVRERADGFVVEEWFDDSGRLREALVRGRTGPGGVWSRHVTVGESGEESSQDASESGLAPDAPPPPVVKRDPAGAFFSGPGCSR